MFSIVILTLNEEENLPACLASTAGCDDVVVLDSGSTDRTVELARAAGARVEVNPFVDFAAQRNHAHRSIAFRHPWVFHLDADEQLTPALVAECAARAEGDDGTLDGCWVAPKMFFLGRWIPHCTDFPAWQARFVHVGRFTFIEVGHGQREHPAMRMGRLRENYRHDLSSHGEAGWDAKHRRYAEAEARTLAADHTPLLPLGRRLLAGPALERRRALKQLSHRLPARPWLRFIYQYLLRGGFLDGRPGLRYCRLLARYERYTDEAVRALRART